MLLRQSFVSNILSCAWPAPTYDAWWQSQSEATAYEWFRASVQLIGCHEGERRWLLKNPGHIDNLDLLFAVFPDAKVIQTHRDPAKAVPSLCSLLMKSHSHFETRPPQQRARIMAAREAGKWAKALRRAEPVRQARPNQILDIRHADFHRAPEDVVDRIYNFIGMEIEDDLRLDIRARIDRKPEMAHGTHRYDIADFGTSPEAVREQFGDYVARFDLLEKKGADQ